ncbi:hypothetical protein Tco_0766412 [Tanacetum coccineum]
MAHYYIGQIRQVVRSVSIKEELRSCDKVIEKGDCSNEVDSVLRLNMCRVDYGSLPCVNVEDGMVKNAASKLGCLVLKTPFTYLVWFFNGRIRRVTKLLGKWETIGATPKNKGGLGVSSCLPLIKGWTGILNKDVSVGSSNLLDIDSSRSMGVTRSGNFYCGSKLNASSLDNSFQRKARSGIEEMQLNSLAEISQMTTLVPARSLRLTVRKCRVFSMVSFERRLIGIGSGC